MGESLSYRFRQVLSVILVLYVGLIVAGGLKEGIEPALAALPWIAFGHFCLALAVYPWRGKRRSDNAAPSTMQPVAQFRLDSSEQSTRGIKTSVASSGLIYWAIATILVLAVLHSLWLERPHRGASDRAPFDELEAMFAEQQRRPTSAGPSGDNVPNLFSPPYDAAIQAKGRSEAGSSATHESLASWPEVTVKYRRLRLLHGISIEIPADWKILSIKERDLIGDLADAVVGAKGPGKTTLLAANNSDLPMQGLARVSIGDNELGISQASLAELESQGPSALSSLSEVTEQQLRKVTDASGVRKIFNMEPVRIGKWGSDRALVVAYLRRSASGGLMEVTQYRIPTRKHLIELTLTYRLSEAGVLGPIVKHIRDSFEY